MNHKVLILGSYDRYHSDGDGSSGDVVFEPLTKKIYCHGYTTRFAQVPNQDTWEKITGDEQKRAFDLLAEMVTLPQFDFKPQFYANTYAIPSISPNVDIWVNVNRGRKFRGRAKLRGFYRSEYRPRTYFGFASPAFSSLTFWANLETADGEKTRANADFIIPEVTEDEKRELRDRLLSAYLLDKYNPEYGCSRAFHPFELWMRLKHEDANERYDGGILSVR